MAREKNFKFKMNDPKGAIPLDGYIDDDGILVMPRLMRPKEIAKYNLTDLNEGFTKLTIYRTSINMRQNTLAKVVGVSVKTVQAWELRGLNEAKAIKAVKVAEVLKCKVEDLMEDED